MMIGVALIAMAVAGFVGVFLVAAWPDRQEKRP